MVEFFTVCQNIFRLSESPVGIILLFVFVLSVLADFVFFRKQLAWTWDLVIKEQVRGCLAQGCLQVDCGQRESNPEPFGCGIEHPNYLKLSRPLSPVRQCLRR